MVSPTWQGLESSCRLLLHFFSKVIWQEEIVHIPLIAQGVLTMGPDRSIKMVLNLTNECECFVSRGRTTYGLLETGLVRKERPVERRSSVMREGIGLHRANSVGCGKGIWGGYKRIKGARAGNTSAAISL